VCVLCSAVLFLLKEQADSADWNGHTDVLFDRLEVGSYFLVFYVQQSCVN